MRKASPKSASTKLVRGKVTATTLAEIQALAALPDEMIDLSDPDAPEVTDWSGSTPGPAVYRPLKRLKSIRLDADVLLWFEASGPGYQTRINATLRKAMLEATQGSAKRTIKEKG